MDEAARDRLRDAVLPVEDLKAAAPHLRRPFSPPAIGWKVQSSGDNWGIVVAYIDARLVIERLNAVIPHRWTERFELFGSTGKTMMCHLTINGVTHSDVGSGTDAKAILSDARKRAAVPFGVGVSIYALPVVRMQTGSGPGKLRRREHKGKVYVDITDDTRKTLNERYEAWLEETGEPAFGPVLDHGDVYGAAGFENVEPVEEEAPESDLPADLPVLDTPEAEQLRGRIRLAYDALREADPQAMLPAIFAGKLTAAGASIDGLEAMLVEVNDMAKEARG